jgi:diadenylate cyclase
MAEERAKENEFEELIKITAPGTLLREGLENIIKAKTGGLIVVGDTPEVMSVVDGGFLINKDYTPANIYELAKMDGAIVLSKDLKKIIYANAQLIPDHKISTVETGTRHRTAERVAKQTGELVVCISKRRNVITLFKGTSRYFLRDTATILSRANQALQTLEKYTTALDIALNSLSVSEFHDVVSLESVVTVVQRSEMVMRIVDEIRRYVYELGNEGRLVNMQLEELAGDSEKEALLIIEDYILFSEEKTSEEVLKSLRALSYEELMDANLICKLLGYQGGVSALDLNLSPKGLRILNKLPKLPMNIIRNLIDRFVNLQGVIRASIDELDDVEGIGEVRAKSIKEGLRRTFDVLSIGGRGMRWSEIMDIPEYFQMRRH